MKNCLRIIALLSAVVLIIAGCGDTGSKPVENSAQGKTAAAAAKVNSGRNGTLSKDKFLEWADRGVEEVLIMDHTDGASSDAVDLSEEENGSVLGWKEENKLYIAGKGNVRAPKDCSYLFSDASEDASKETRTWEKLTKVTGAELLDMSQVTDMSGMFMKCRGLQEVNVSNWDTSQVTDMSSMFNYCENLLEADVSNWDTSQVTDMHQLFHYCVNLQELDVSKWDTSRVTDMSGLFSACSKP